MSNPKVRAYNDRIVIQNSEFNISEADRDLFDMIKGICFDMRKEEPSVLDLSGSAEGHLFVVVAGGWPRDLVVSIDSR